MRKYVLCPDWVRSTTDGDEHYIDARTLARLYGVPLVECYVYNEGFQRMSNRPKGLIYLQPRYHGDYKEWLSQADPSAQT